MGLPPLTTRLTPDAHLILLLVRTPHSTCNRSTGISVLVSTTGDIVVDTVASLLVVFILAKGLSIEEFSACNDLVLALPDRIQAIPDGTAIAPRKNGGWATTDFRAGIKFDSDGRFDDEYFQENEHSSQFRQEFEMQKIKQDQGLDMISEGLDTLKDMAQDINEELDRQVPLMDEIDEKVDKATSDLKSTNVRLKETVMQLRSSRNFCIDIILLCIILGIAAYLYNVLKN